MLIPEPDGFLLGAGAAAGRDQLEQSVRYKPETQKYKSASSAAI